MPQDPQGNQIPGEDVLLDTLRRSSIRDDQRQQIWDAYHTQGKEDDFVGSLNKLGIGDDVKQTLYDMRYKGFKNMPSNTQASTVANLNTQAPAKGDVRPSTPDVLNKTTGISARPTTWTDRIGAVVAPFMQHVRQGGAAQDPRLLAPEAAMTPTEQSQHPMLRAAGEFAGSLTTGGNLALIAGTAGIGGAAPALSKVLGFAFSAQMLQGAYDRYAPLKEAWDKGDEEGVKYHLTHMLLSGALGLHGVTDGMSTDPKTRLKVREEIKAQAKNKGTDGPLNAAVRQAALLPDTPTPMGPISEKGGQGLQLDFVTKAPIEAQAPQDTGGASKVANAPAREVMAQTPSTSRGTSLGERGSLPPELHADLEKQAGRKLTPSDAVALDRSNMERGMASGIGKADESSAIREQKRSELEKPDPTRYAPIDKSISSEAIEGFVTPQSKGARQEIVETVVKAGDLHKNLDNFPNPSHVHLLEDATGLNLTSKTGGEVLAELAKKGYKVPGLEQAYQQGFKLSSEVQKAQYSLKGNVSQAVNALTQSTDVVSLLKNNFNKVADLNRQIDLAENDSHASDLTKQKDQLENQTLEALKQQPLGPQHVQAFKETADRLETQAKAVRDLTEATIKNRGVKNELADLRSQGGPPRTAVVDPETGERALIKPEDKVGRGARSVLDELQGRVPTSEFDALKVAGKPEGVSDQEWTEHVGKLQEERQGLKRKISDSVTIASETGASVADMGIEEHVDRLKQIEGLLGKYVEPAEPGRRPQKPVELGDKGEIKATEPLKSWTWARVKAAFGGKYKQIPSDEEFFQEADHLQERGRLFRKAADVALEVSRLRTQRGGIGEIALRGEVKPVSLVDKVPPDNELMRRAAEAKLYTVKIDDTFTGGHVGLLSKDGRTWIETGRLTHDAVAGMLIPEVRRDGSALRAMLEKGWIRKAGPREYESWDLDTKAKSAIEMDLYRTGRHGQEVFLDTRMPTGRMVPGGLTLESGWDDFDKALVKAQRKAGLTGELGALKTGTQSLIGGTVGAVAGGVIGAHLTGEPYAGAAIGWGLGFMSPAIVNHPLFWNKINAMKPMVTNLGIKMSDWLGGVKQLDPVNADMKRILDAQQRDVKGPTKSFLTRVAQLPGDLQSKLFDKFVFINDRPGAMINLLMKFDERGRAFRDLRGKLDVDNSPYVSAWLAAGGGGGHAEAHLLDYKKIYSEAQGKGLVNNLNEYLNLKGYQRVYDVMTERIQEADQNIQKLGQALQQKNLPVEIEAGMKKALREAKAERQDVIDKLTSKTLVPQPYDPPKIASDLQALQTQLGPKFNDVKAIADRVFGLNRKILDMVHNSGIVSDLEYQKYTSRGDEYIPMHRILEQIADNTGKNYGLGTPLYLRQQNVIKALMGSDRVNRDPIVASADANLEALREVARNSVIQDYLKIAQADPQGVGSYFKQVKSGYKAQPGEGVVGVYDNGGQTSFAVPSWLSESLKNVSPASADIIGKGPLRYFGQVLRKGATVGNLAWSVPNALRHLGDMAIMSDAGLKDIRTLPRDAAGLIREWNKSLYSTIVADSARQEFLRSGAAYSTLQSAISPEQHLDPTTLGFRQKVMHGRLVDVVADFNKAVEDATKMTTYKLLRQAGYSEKNAAWETRRYGGGPDFARQGNLTPAIGMVSMFFNAHLQYVTRVFARAAENPARVAVALGAISALAMTLNEHNYNQKDEKGNLLMRKVPYTDRENNFVVLTGDTYQSSSGATLPVYYKVPKPSFVKFLYNPIENMLNKVSGHEERSGTQLGLQALGNLSPGQMDLKQDELGKSAARGITSSLNPIIKTPLEELMNYKTTGAGSPIVPVSQTGIASQYQYGPGTSETAKRIGEGGVRGAVAGGAEGAGIGYLVGGPKGAAVGGGLGSILGTFGISPRRAEHVIDSTTAGVGRIATGFVEPFLGGVKQTHMEGPEKLANTPVAGPILGRFVSTSIDQQEQSLTEQFYRDAQKAQEPLKTLQYLKKNSPQQIPAFLDKYKNELWMGQVATTMQQRLGQIQNAQKMIEQNETMPQADRAEALKNLHDIKLQVLGTFTKVMRPSPQVGQAASAPGQGQGAPR